MRARVSADMAYRLAAAFGTSAEVWGGLQLQSDLSQAAKTKRPRIERLTPRVDDLSAREWRP